MKKIGKKAKVFKPGEVEKYITGCPKEIQENLRKMRAVIREVAPGANKKELEKYDQTKAIISFPARGHISKTLVKKLVKSSLKDMMGSRK